MKPETRNCYQVWPVSNHFRSLGVFFFFKLIWVESESKFVWFFLAHRSATRIISVILCYFRKHFSHPLGIRTELIRNSKNNQVQTKFTSFQNCWAFPKCSNHFQSQTNPPRSRLIKPSKLVKNKTPANSHAPVCHWWQNTPRWRLFKNIEFFKNK